MAWVDFFICLFFGYTGVMRFKDKEIGMGFLYLFTVGLLGVGWLYDCYRYLRAAIRGERIIGAAKKDTRRLADDEPLPVVQNTNALLNRDEICRYYGPAAFLEVRNVVVGYKGGNSGFSIPITKNMTYHTSSSNARPIRKNVQNATPGMLTITDRRIIFSGNKGTFDKKLSELSSITPYSDGISFQFGQKQYPLKTDEPTYIFQIIARIVNQGLS